MLGLVVNVLALGIGFAIASPVSHHRYLEFHKRELVPTSTDPTCIPFVVGQNPNTGGDVCFSISSDHQNLIVTYPPVTVLDSSNYVEVHVRIDPISTVYTGTANGQIPGPFGQFPYTSANGACTINNNHPVCTIPLSDLGTNLCDSQWKIVTHAKLVGDTSTGTPDQTGTGGTHCIAPDCTPWFVYGTFTIKCSEDKPPVEYTWCDIGTAYGYCSAPVSPTLNSLSPLPNSCKHWGWYVNPTSVQLAAGIGGTLYVGAGGNDLSKAIDVGSWDATLAGTTITVHYTLKAGFDLSEVHIYASATKPGTCAPGQFGYVVSGGSLADTDDQDWTATISVSSASSYYLILHAKVSERFEVTDGFVCPGAVTG